MLGGLGIVKRASGMNPLGLFLAGLILAGVTDGWRGVKALLARLVRVRFHVKWFLIALLLAPALAFLALAIGLLLGAKLPGNRANPADLIPTFLIMFFFVGLGEEPGWRGFLLPTLQHSYPPLKSSLIVGVVWAVWHAPLYGTQIPWEQTVPFFLNVIAGSVVIAWIFNGARESVLLTMLMHAVNNTVGGAYVSQLLHGADLTHWWWIFTALWVLVAALVALLAGPSFRSRQQP
jgi:membrane protease YdiL (CAAX protease family)